MQTGESIQKISDNNIKKKNYQKVNAYSHQSSKSQILAVVIFFVILILHTISVLRGFIAINKTVVFIFIGLHYFFLIMIVYDYFYLTCSDPIDPLVKGVKKYQTPQNQFKIKQCKICQSYTDIKSYHCMKCNRCTYEMDHHCSYLNNCVSSKNYEQFFRLLMVITFYLLNIIGQSLYIFSSIFQNDTIQQIVISRWLVLGLIVIAFFTLIPVDVLLVFHLYLVYILHMTTLEYVFRQIYDKDSSNNSQIHKITFNH